MIFMIRVFLLIGLLVGCSSSPLTELFTASIQQSLGMNLKNNVTREYFNNQPYSLMEMRFGKASSVILVLAYIGEDNVYEWVSSDGIRVFTLDGFIIKTIGLDHDIRLTTPYREVSFNVGSTVLMNYVNPELYLVRYKILDSVMRDDSSFQYLNEEIKAKEEEIHLRIEDIRKDIIYKRVLADKKILYSSQLLHPFYKTVELYFYLK